LHVTRPCRKIQRDAYANRRTRIATAYPRSSPGSNLFGKMVEREIAEREIEEINLTTDQR
jgi:hypothetical protein